MLLKYENKLTKSADNLLICDSVNVYNETSNSISIFLAMDNVQNK
jgi:hypothetical protein